MNNQILPAGSRVRVISYGPFRGLKGTIRTVDTIPGPAAGEAFCFYLVALEGTHIKDPIWFECDEVELVDVHLQRKRGTWQEASHLQGIGLKNPLIFPYIRVKYKCSRVL